MLRSAKRSPHCDVEMTFRVQDFSTKLRQRTSAMDPCAVDGTRNLLRRVLTHTYHTLPQTRNMPELSLSHPQRGDIYLRDTRREGVSWLEKMLVSARIVEL